MSFPLQPDPSATDPSGTDPRMTALPPEPVRQSISWWTLVGLLGIVTIMLFLPWSTPGGSPTADLRQELVWSAVATVVIGVVGLVFPGRWMAFLAALPTIGALTDIGPVLWPESGTYPWPVKVVVLAIAATGITWIVSAFTFPAREQSTRWIVVPVAAALTLATLWLPWVIVSQVGSDSGSKTAIDLIFTTKASAPGIWVARVGIIVIMLVGIAGAILPLTSRRRTVTFVATWLTSSAVAGLVLLCLWLSVRGDAVMAATSSTGQRVAITGFMLIALVWNARLKAARSPYADDVMEHSGIIPIIMTSEPPRSRQYRADRAIAS